MAWAGIVNRAFTAETVGPYLRTLKRPSFVKFVVVHNTGAPSLKTYRGYANRANPISDAQWLRNLEGYYRDQQKWSAGPHWFVTPNPVGILAFTPSTVRGTHSPSWNAESLGVEMVGDFQSESFDAGVQRNVIALLAELHIWLDISPDTIRFHREDVNTTHKDCPGKNVVKSALIAAVKAKVAQIKGNLPVAMLDMPTDADMHPDVPDSDSDTTDISARRKDPETAVVTVDADHDTHVEETEASAEADSETRTSWVKRKWRGLTGWIFGGGGAVGLGWLTDWRVVAVLLAGVFGIAVVVVLFMGPGDVRAWIRKQVS